ncbi:unnamed protein product [Ectocarpus sp. 6 AP-2014]
MPRQNQKSLGAKLKSLGQTNLSTLGSSAQSSGVGGIIVALLFLLFIVFANFHAIYLKTGTPMLKYGLALTFLQPFYSIWATWQLTSKYALGK